MCIMRYFYVTDKESLIALQEFGVTESQSQIVRIPVLDGTTHSQTGRAGHVPHGNSVAASRGRSVYVVGEDCTIYSYEGGNMSIENGRLVVTGVVYQRFAVEEQHRAAALQTMQAALTQAAGTWTDTRP